jgi:hypothetical protein
MRTVKHFVLATLTLGALGGLVSYQAADSDKPKNSIEEVMEKAHKGKESLYKKVVSGKANADQKKELLGLYEDLAKNKPEKGSQEDWKKRTTAIVGAAKEVAEEKPGAAPKLMKAVNCKGCHDLHRGQ